MPELPEIFSRAAELQAVLPGKRFSGFEIIQPKSLNIPQDEFLQALTSAEVIRVYNHGKWIFIETDQGYLLINLGMGGEINLCTPSTLPVKHRFVILLNDGEAISINFWWFGYIHYLPSDQLLKHSLTSTLGPNVLDLTETEFSKLITGLRGRVKAFLLDQKNLAGIGNAYIHDILFLARLHPLRQISTLSPVEISGLYSAIRQGLEPAIELGGAFYEQTIYGQPGGFTMDHILIGYKGGKPCPVCATPIQKIKTSSNSSFICPSCQPLD
jgi:formamidopyrimidine-DNA glycosylase